MHFCSDLFNSSQTMRNSGTGGSNNHICTLHSKELPCCYEKRTVNNSVHISDPSDMS